MSWQAPEGDDDDVKLQKFVGVVIACCIVGFVILNILVVFVTGHQDPGLKSRGAKHVNSIVAIFIAVSVAHSVMRCFDFYVIVSILNGSGVVYPSRGWGLFSWAMKLPIFMFWFLCTTRLSYRYRESATDLACILTLCSNVTAFTAMEIFSNFQYDLAIAVAHPWFSVVWHWAIVVVAAVGLRVLIGFETLFAGGEKLDPLHSEASRRTEAGIELASPKSRLETLETPAPSSNLGAATGQSVDKVLNSSGHVTWSEEVSSEVPAPVSYANSSPDMDRSFTARRKKMKSLGHAMRLAAKSTGTRRSLRSSIDSSISWTWCSHSPTIRHTMTTSTGAISKEWIKDLLAVDAESSAMAVGFLVKEAIEAHVTGRCSNFMDVSDDSSTEGEVFMTFLFAVGTMVIALVLRRMEATVLMYKYLSKSNLDYVHGIFSAAIGWLFFSIFHMSVSISITQRACENLSVSFILSIALALLVILFSKLEARWEFEGSEAVEDLLGSIGMTTGFCWESSWSLAIHSLCFDGGVIDFGKKEQVVESLVCLTSVALIMPGWRFYVLPYALNCEVTEVAKDENEEALLSPRSPTSAHEISSPSGGRWRW